MSEYILNLVLTQKVMQWRDCDLYYRCHDSEHIFGAGFVVNKRISHMVTGFEPLGMRMCYLGVKSRFFSISIINAHAPTEDKEEEKGWKEHMISYQSMILGI
jgi:hypothetical protein